MPVIDPQVAFHPCSCCSFEHLCRRFASAEPQWAPIDSGQWLRPVDAVRAGQPPDWHPQWGGSIIIGRRKFHRMGGATAVLQCGSPPGAENCKSIMTRPKQRVLFLCTGNSCRSQMAEGLLRHLANERFEAVSAGSRPAGYVHENAVRVMSEFGIDISSLRSKSINEFLPPNGTPPDLIISVCSGAEKECPAFPGSVERWHWPFDDPAYAVGTDAEKLAEFCRVRDEIREALLTRLVDLDTPPS